MNRNSLIHLPMFSLDGIAMIKSDRLNTYINWNKTKQNFNQHAITFYTLLQKKPDTLFFLTGNYFQTGNVRKEYLMIFLFFILFFNLRIYINVNLQ